MPKVRHWSMTGSEKSKKPNFILLCRYSSVVEHVIGNDGVVSPILTSGTIFENAPFEVLFCNINQNFRLVRFWKFWNKHFHKFPPQYKVKTLRAHCYLTKLMVFSTYERNRYPLVNWGANSATKLAVWPRSLSWLLFQYLNIQPRVNSGGSVKIVIKLK